MPDDIERTRRPEISRAVMRPKIGMAMSTDVCYLSCVLAVQASIATETGAHP